MTARVVFLHMGLHKTGTTSIQHWMQANQQVLADADLAVFQGRYTPANHIEFGLSALREDLDAPVKRRLDYDRAQIFQQTKSDLRQFFSTSPQRGLIVSNETMSFIRSQTEMDRLAALFPSDVSVIPIVFLRPKSEWLASFRSQMRSMGLDDSNDPQSCGYFGPDSWLLQHEVLVDLAQRTFGACRVHSYCGASLGQFLATIGIDTDTEEPRLNVTSNKRAR